MRKREKRKKLLRRLRQRELLPRKLLKKQNKGELSERKKKRLRGLRSKLGSEKLQNKKQLKLPKKRLKPRLRLRSKPRLIPCHLLRQPIT